MSRRVNFSPDDVHDQINPTNFYFKKKSSSSSTWNSRLQKSSSYSSSSSSYVASFVKNIGTKVASALNFFSNSNRKRSSRKVSSSTSLARSRSYAETSIYDSQRAQAIEDCIEFLNSSSLHRSSSVSSTTC